MKVRCTCPYLPVLSQELQRGPQREVDPQSRAAGHGEEKGGDVAPSDWL